MPQGTFPTSCRIVAHFVVSHATPFVSKHIKFASPWFSWWNIWNIYLTLPSTWAQIVITPSTWSCPCLFLCAVIWNFKCGHIPKSMWIHYRRMYTEYVATVDEAVSSLFFVSRCFLSSTNVRPFISTLNFTLWTFVMPPPPLSVFVIFVASTKEKVSSTFSWFRVGVYFHSYGWTPSPSKIE